MAGELGPFSFNTVTSALLRDLAASLGGAERRESEVRGTRAHRLVHKDLHELFWYRIIRTFFKFLQTVENGWDRSRRVTILCGEFMLS